MANLNLLLAFPEYKVSIPPYKGRPSQNDIFVLAKSGSDLVTITVEGKVSEPFDLTVAEWALNASEGKVTESTGGEDNGEEGTFHAGTRKEYVGNAHSGVPTIGDTIPIA